MKTKDKILKSALKLFAKQGIKSTSTAQITDDVGISSGALFVHFSTKQKLIDELYIRIKKKAFSDLHKTVDLNKSVEENIKSLSKNAIQYFIKNYSEFIFMELVENDPLISKEALMRGSNEYKEITTFLDKWRNERILKNIDVQTLEAVIWSIITVMVKKTRTKTTRKPQETEEIFLNLIWDAIKA